MAATVTTHVLDVARGKPAEGVAVALQRRAADGSWAPVTPAATDADGRAGPLEPGAGAGAVRLVFDTEAYWAAQGARGFFPEVTVTFELPADGHCHVPLLLSPFGYSTYRGT